MTLSARCFRVTSFTLLLATSPLPAFAQSGSDSSEASGGAAREKAKGLFQKGAASYKAGRYKEAIDLFLAANDVLPSPALSYNIARAYEKIYDAGGALRFYRLYLRQAADAQDRGEVEARIGELESKLAERGVQQVSVYSIPERATVVVDGSPVGVTPWTGEVKPGSHSLELRLAGYQPHTQDFELPKERAIDVEATLVADSGTGSVAPATPTAPSSVEPDRPQTQPKPDQGSGISPLAWIGLGVGAAALGGALFFELQRRSKEDEAKSVAVQVDAQSAYDDMETNQTLARVFLGVGAAAAITGGVLLTLGLTKKKSDSVGFACLPGACGVSARGRF